MMCVDACKAISSAGSWAEGKSEGIQAFMNKFPNVVVNDSQQPPKVAK